MSFGRLSHIFRPLGASDTTGTRQTHPREPIQTRNAQNLSRSQAMSPTSFGKPLPPSLFFPSPPSHRPPLLPTSPPLPTSAPAHPYPPPCPTLLPSPPSSPLLPTPPCLLLSDSSARRTTRCCAFGKYLPCGEGRLCFVCVLRMRLMKNNK